MTPADALHAASAAAGATASAAAAAAAGAAAGAPGAASGVVAADIHDIRGAKFLLPWWAVPAAIAGAVALAIAIYAIIRWRRRARAGRVLSSFELALKRLDEIRPLMVPEQAREFSTAASDIVRTYIEQRFDVVATQRTTEEFLRDLLDSSRESLIRHRALLSDFLHQCDLVKFAGLVTLTPQTMEALHRSARAFVLETSQPDPPPAVTAAPAAPAAVVPPAVAPPAASPAKGRP